MAADTAAAVDRLTGTLSGLFGTTQKELTLTGVTIAGLPGTPSTGTIAHVTDGDSSLALGATVVNSGSGATAYLVWYNGTNWTIIGK